MKGRVLIIAGSDSSGGAGIQADIKTVTALKGYASTAITSVTAQNTLGVQGIYPVDATFITLQIRVVLDDIGSDAIKLGMLGSVSVIEAVASMVSDPALTVPLIVDPVMISKSGHYLLEPQAIETLQQVILPLATVVTPNLLEAQSLTGHEIHSVDDMRKAAMVLRDRGSHAVLIKGGHLEDSTLTDVLVTDQGEHLFQSQRIDTRHTHGTGCTLASAIAVNLAQGKNIVDAVSLARTYVYEAIRLAPGYGQGHGPLDHTHLWSRDQ